MKTNHKTTRKVEILLAEDSPTQAAQLVHLLEQNGYLVTVAANGREALALLERCKPSLVISDIVMPELDGYGLCKAIKADENLKNIPVMLVTTLADPQDVIRGLACGADNFLRKPYNERYLLSRIDYLLMNRELRKSQKMQMGMEIDLGGQKHFISSERQQILDLLISTYEQAVEINSELKQREKELAHSKEVLNGLYRIADGLNHAVSEREVVEMALDRALELPGIQAGWIYLREGESGFRLATARNLSPTLLGGCAMEGLCDCQRRFLAGELDHVINIMGCERLKGVKGDTHGLRYHASVPLWICDRSLGIMNLVGADQGLFNDDELEILDGVGHQVGVALERARLHEHLEGLVEERTAELTAEIVERNRAEKQFHTLFEFAPDAVVMIDQQGMVALVNRQAETVFGYQRDELLGQPVEMLMPEDFRRAHVDLRQGFLRHTMPRVMSVDRPGLLGLRKDGTTFPVDISLSPMELDGRMVVVASVRDITERKEAEKRLYHLAHYDAFTGLPNRTMFYEVLKKTLAQASGNGWQVAVLYIDLDQFKNVNDTLGHAIGDELLSQFSNRLVQCVRIRDTVGRLGGDEFALILVLQNGQQDAALVAHKIREGLRAPFDLKGHEVIITASIGITLHPEDASDPETLIKYADMAMYRAKQAGRDTFRFFTAQMNADVLARLDLETALRKAVEKGEFVLYYQPKVQLHTGRIAGLEALLRWQRPGHGLVSPHEFISVLEETGLIVRVGSWVIATACKQIGRWMRSSIGLVPISVNVSGSQFIEGNLDEEVIKALGDNDIPADLLELELTESSLMENAEHTIISLQNLKKRGVQISIDDFGTGYSSLAYLHRFPIDKLKIDIAFIRDVTSNPDDAAIVRTIISMAHSLKLEVIAEGVETAEQLAHLRSERCDQIQGYYFSRPLPVPELEQMLLERRCLPNL